MPSIPVNQLSRGQAIVLDGQINVIISMEHVKPGKGPAYQQTKMRNLETGKITEKRFRSAETVEQIDIDRRTYTFSYRNGDIFVFMDTATYEEVEVAAEILGEEAEYLLEGNEVSIQRVEGRVVGVELPAAVEMEVTQADPGVKNATATNVFKNATLETGLQVQVPAFINVGDRIKIETGTGKYLERVDIG